MPAVLQFSAQHQRGGSQVSSSIVFKTYKFDRQLAFHDVASVLVVRFSSVD